MTYDQKVLTVRCPTCRVAPDEECTFAVKRRLVYPKTAWGKGHYPRFHATRERRAHGQDWASSKIRR